MVGDWNGASTQDRLTISRHYEKELITGVVSKRYYAGNRLLATRTGSALYFIQPDHLGSASTVTDASGQVVARERYSAFGERRRGESPATTDYLYTDQRTSAFVGFYHYTSGAPGRMYDPLQNPFWRPPRKPFPK